MSDVGVVPPARRSILRTRSFRFFLIGLAAAFLLQWTQARALGGWAGLLSVGEVSTLRPLIEAELGPVPLVSSTGHDGQLTFAIAHDLLGREVTDIRGDAPYRYRRILHPVLSSGFGALQGWPVLYLMSFWAAAGFGLATAAVDSLAQWLKARAWAAVGTIANPGMWLSVQLLTSDTLSAGLALGGLAVWLRGRKGVALVLLALATLAKDQYVLIPLALAAWELGEKHPREAGYILGAGLGPLAMWMLWIGLTIPGNASSPESFSPPLVGIVEGVRLWPGEATKDMFYGAVALLSVVGAAVTPALIRNRVVRLFAWPWVALALVLSPMLWAHGNNAVRVLAPCLIFGVLASAVVLAQRVPTKTSLKNLPV